MFDTYIYDNRSVKDAARIIARSNKEHDETLKSISEAEIKSKDRVDIPLSEYLNMKKEIERLSRRVSHTDKLIIQMGIPAETIDNIISGTIKVETCNDYLDYTRAYRITFKTDLRGSTYIRL